MTDLSEAAGLRLAPEYQAPHGALCLALQQADVRLGITGQVHALRAVDLRIAVGERVALVGSNGCGKSSLLRALHGLLPLSAGTLERARELRVAMLFQRPYLMRLSVLNNIALGLWLQGVPWRRTAALALEALQRVGMDDLAQRHARALSGGQLQRLALARAWALRPSLWLLDEPTASLDPHAKREVELLMADLAASHGQAGPGHPVTMVFSSHNLGQVKRLASRVIYLEHGAVLADLPVHDFFNGPLPQAAALFVQGEKV